MEIGQKIKKMRKEAGISQEELAFALEVSRQTVTRWERGRMIPDTERVAARAKYFGVTADELMNDEKTIFGVLTAVGVVLTAAFAISRAVKRRKA